MPKYEVLWKGIALTKVRIYWIYTFFLCKILCIFIVSVSEFMN